MFRLSALSGAAMVATPLPAMAAAELSPVEQACELLKLCAYEAHASSDDRFLPRKVTSDDNGTRHVRMERRYRGLRVIGGEVVVNMDSTGRLIDLDVSLPDTVNLDALEANVSETQALQFAEEPSSVTPTAWREPSASSMPAPAGRSWPMTCA